MTPEDVGINFEAIRLVTSGSDWEFFREHGWIVKPGTSDNIRISPETAKRWLGQLQQWIINFSSISGTLMSFHEGPINDLPQLWTPEDIPASTRDSGYITRYISHSDLMWGARMFLKNLFADIWDNDYLFTSFEGATYAVDNGNRFVTHATREHISITQDGRGDRCLGIQGMISLVEVSQPEAGGIFVVEGSHNDFPRLPDSRVALKDVTGELVRPVMQPGDVLLMDTRLLKGSVRPRQTEDFHQPFASLWVTMMPRIALSEADKQKRVDFFYNHVTTGPWCYSFKLEALPPQSTIGKFLTEDKIPTQLGRIAVKTDFTVDHIELVVGLSPQETEALRSKPTKR